MAVKKIKKCLSVIVIIMFLLTTLSGCTDNCTDEISWHVSPSTITMGVDEVVKINVNSATCDNKKNVDLAWSFKSENTDVATVDSEGIVTGESAGSTRIAVSFEKAGLITSWVDITVK